MRGITFLDASNESFRRHTADDWDLVMTKKVIGTPPVKWKTVELKDRDGDLDFTNALRGVPSYGSRELSFSFEYLGSPEEWSTLVNDIRGFLHGRRLKIREPDDLHYYYLGYAEMSDPTGGLVKSFTVTVRADTWKYKNGSATTVTETATAGTVIRLVNDWRPVVPRIRTTGAVTLSFNGTTYTISGAGSFRFPKMVLKYGLNPIEIVSGSGEITFTYQEGAI